MSPVKSPEGFHARDVGKEDKIVVKGDEVEELLPGWRKEVKIRKTGSATKVDRFYTDPVTGYIFRSLKDVQRYLKTGELGRLAIKPKIEEREKTTELQEHTSETSRLKRSPTDKSELPARASKRLAGVDGDVPSPSPPAPPPRQPKTRQATQLAGIKIDAPSPSQSLPEPKTRQATRLAGMAVDVPHSRPEPKTRHAIQLMEMVVDASLPSPSPPEPKTRQATRLAGISVDAPLSKLEPKSRQATRLAGVVVDAPPSSSEPKTRQATRLAGVAVNAPPSPSPSEPKTRQATRLAGLVVDAPPSPSDPKIRQAPQLAGVAVTAPQSPSEPKTSQATRLVEMAVDASLPSPPEPKTRQATRLARVAVDASLPITRTNHQATRQFENKTDASVPSPPPIVPKTCQAALQAGTKTDSLSPLPPPASVPSSPPSLPEPKPCQAKRVSGSRDNASLPSPPQPKSRRAIQQAGIKINPPPPLLPDARTGRQSTRTIPVTSTAPNKNDKKTEAEKITGKRNENAGMDAHINHNQEIQESIENQELRNLLPPVTPEEQHNKQIERGPITSPPPEAQPPPTVVPPLNLQKQESSFVNPTNSSPVPQDSYGYVGDMKPESSISFSMNDLWTDPCIEFAVKTLTGAIPFTDLNKVENFTAPLEVPLEELWTDPCIEFAVKTLTGAIPVGEDDYLLNRPASSSNPQGSHNFSSPMNVCQTDILPKHYETGHKNKQQDSTFPTLGSVGLQKSGKFVNGSNGQCSRSVFFQ